MKTELSSPGKNYSTVIKDNHFDNMKPIHPFYYNME